MSQAGVCVTVASVEGRTVRVLSARLVLRRGTTVDGDTRRGVAERAPKEALTTKKIAERGEVS